MTVCYSGSQVIQKQCPVNHWRIHIFYEDVCFNIFNKNVVKISHLIWSTISSEAYVIKLCACKFFIV